MKRTKGKGINFVVYEPATNSDEFFGSRDPRDLNALTAWTDVIIAGRQPDNLTFIANKVFTRDLLGSD